MKNLSYEVTNPKTNITRVMSHWAVRVIINSNSSDKARENFKKLDDLQINDTVTMTDNYGSTGGGTIVIERIS